MDSTPQNPKRVSYENKSGQKVNSKTGKTVVNKDPEAHHILEEDAD